MLTALTPSMETMRHITRRCADADPFLLQDLQDDCPPGFTVSIDFRERVPSSYYWLIAVQAHPCMFGDFRKLWAKVKRTQEVPVLGMLSTSAVPEGLGPLLKECLDNRSAAHPQGEVPAGAVTAGHVYFLEEKEKKKPSRGRELELNF